MAAAGAVAALNWHVLLEAKPEGMLSLAALTLAALAIGHWLGGPAEEDRTALAIACSTRHLGIAVLVATSAPGPRAAVIVAIYILISVAVFIPYLQWRRRLS